MITLKTSHNHIWQPELVAVDVIKEYQDTGSATISMNQEGPCCDSIGLYKLLDEICNKFNFDKSKITIATCNREELHTEYAIQIYPQHWIQQAYTTSMHHGFTKNYFYKKKEINKNLFGCLYNIPSWNRLSLIAHIKNHSRHQNLLACNGTWESNQHNSYYLNAITDFSPDEIYNIVRLIEQGIGPLPNHPGNKPTEMENTQILSYYNDFFIDVVAETYSNGLTFFITEKTIRPIFGMTPFILFGPQSFLNTLKSDYGFKTFNQWWDESYDNYQNYDRVKKIYQVIDYIDSKSNKELQDMYDDMTDTLEYNFNRLQELNA